MPALLGNLAKRQSFIVKDGKIAWLDKAASTDKQADDVRKALADLGEKCRGQSNPRPRVQIQHGQFGFFVPRTMILCGSH